MSPELVIGLVIFALGCAASYSWRRGWGMPALLFAALEAKARAARARARARELADAEVCCKLCAAHVHVHHVECGDAHIPYEQLARLRGPVEPVS